MKDTLRPGLAVAAGLAVTLLANAVGVYWVSNAVLADAGSYDGWAAILTLALPSLLGGVALGLVARAPGMNLAAVTYALFGLAGLLLPLWRVPLVSPQAAHSGLMHFWLHSFAVPLGLGTLGGWLGSQFSTGKFALADREPVVPGLEE